MDGKKKSVLITVCSFEIGGIEKSLAELLSAFDYDKYDVDVLAFSKKGELLGCIPEKCHLLDEIPVCASMLEPIKQAALKHPLLTVSRAYSKLKTSLKYKNSEASADALVFAQLQSMWDCALPLLPTIKKKYDVALSFMWPHHFVAEKVRADRKIAWVHTDYTVAEMDRKKDEKIWSRFDKIAAVSDECGATFSSVYPSIGERVVTIENVLSAQLVRKRSEEFEPDEMKINGEFKIVSVGRYCHAKAFDRVPEICRKILDDGYNIKWFIIGYGTDEQLIKTKISEQGVENDVMLLGKKTNPYPYVKNADIYAQPSRYEGKAVTVREAQILGRAVVVSDFKTAKSQVNDGVDAIIAEQSAEGIAQCIEELISDKNKRTFLEQNSWNADYGCEKQLAALYEIMG